MGINVCRDIENMKKQYEQYGYNKIEDNLEVVHTGELNDFKEVENNINNLNILLKSMEEINTDVISNKNFLKNVLNEDHEVKKKFIEKIKTTINAYVNFYDYVDDIRQALENSQANINIDLLKLVNQILAFLEKEYSNIGLMIHTPKKGVDKFDNFKHEIISTERKLGLANETIINVIRKGFYYNDRNIRYVRNAKVITVLN